ALLSGGIIGLRQPEVNIQTVTVRGTHYANEQILRHLINNALAGHYLFFIPKTSTFLYPRQAIERDALALFPAVESLDIRRDSFTALSVFVLERKTDALWCHSFASTSPCYLMDETGVVFEKTDTRYESLITYTGPMGAGSPLGAAFMSGDYPALRVFVHDIERATGRTARTVSLDEHEDITVMFGEGGELRYARKDASDALLQNIASVFASSRFRSDDELEYADFRFGNKVYVKFREE
ncbi:MAG: cell division protein FtsQ/DivIB, partial [Candidatus Paceibacteria bacterium]